MPKKLVLTIQICFYLHLILFLSYSIKHNSLNVLLIWYSQSVSFIYSVYQEWRNIRYGIYYEEEQIIYSPPKNVQLCWSGSAIYKIAIVY